jgi:hypothetical protein
VGRPDLPVAYRVLAWLARNPGRGAFTRTEAFTALKDRRDVRTSEALAPASRLLVEHDYLRPLDRPEAARPGPVPEAYVVAHLTDTPAAGEAVRPIGNEPWDSRVALALMDTADALVEGLGVDDRHPEVRDAAAMVTSAHATRDLETLRLAVGEFTVVARTLASAGPPNRDRRIAASAACGQTTTPT